MGKLIDNMNQKEKLLNSLEVLINNINDENLEDLVVNAKELGFDFRFSSPLIDFMKNIYINFIKNYVIINGPIKIPRKTHYGIDTFDYYEINDNILYRNGHKINWTPFFKVYTTYIFLQNANIQIQS